MAVVSGEHDRSLTPADMLLDPLSNGQKSLVAGQYRADGIVDVVRVVGPINIASSDHQPHVVPVVARAICIMPKGSPLAIESAIVLVAMQ